MYTMSIFLSSTKEGKEELEKRYARILAKITTEILNQAELEVLIDKLESQEH
ncbi:hypothetical protein [uncultured Clostridium sp.]|uniref:hypothetical protein n=1 Tax=uncultured Clostridium sp. TaxID=59620 RepID=UPI0028E9BE01|nr:hypothetical protein [uncultured Clostridium sp.]